MQNTSAITTLSTLLSRSEARSLNSWSRDIQQIVCDEITTFGLHRVMHSEKSSITKIYIAGFEIAVVLVRPFRCIWVNVNSSDNGILPICPNVVVKQSSFKAKVHGSESRTWWKDLFYE